MVISYELCSDQKKKTKNTTGFLAEVGLREAGTEAQISEKHGAELLLLLCREEPVKVDQAFSRRPPAHLPAEVLEMFMPGCPAAGAEGLETEKRKKGGEMN